MTVHLVGAGPGDPDLLTLRAARLLATCDAVVYDRLLDPALLDLVGEHAERIDVGKRPGQSAGQELINTVLVDLGRRGLEVVRLKGGDPYVFGRGGEEVLALAAAGVPFAVVPGVSSAVAAPAAAGVPVTHRGLAAAFTVVTGHRQHGAHPVDWRALARVGGTIVVLMGVAERADIAAELIAGGLDGATPAVAVQWATHPTQRTVRTTVSGLAEAAVASPATIVIGPAAGLDLTPEGVLATLDAAARSAP